MKNRIMPLGPLVVLVSMACYTYVPARVDEVPLQSDVRAVLSTEGQINIRERVGLDGGRLEGELVERSGDQIMIAVPVTGPFSGTTGEPLYQRIDLPARDVLLMEVREPSVPKTVAFLGGAAGLVAVIAIVTFGGEQNPGTDGPEPPPPDERFIPRLPVLLRVP